MPQQPVDAGTEPTSQARRLRFGSAPWLVGALIASVALVGCNAPGGLTASSTCADFNKGNVQKQQEIVLALYDKSHPQEPKAGPGAANAVLNVSYECGQNPSVKLGELGDFHAR